MMRRIIPLLVSCFILVGSGCARIPKSGVIGKPGRKDRERIARMNERNMKEKMMFSQKLEEIKERTRRNGHITLEDLNTVLRPPAFIRYKEDRARLIPNYRGFGWERVDPIIETTYEMFDAVYLRRLVDEDLLPFKTAFYQAIENEDYDKAEITRRNWIGKLEEIKQALAGRGYAVPHSVDYHLEKLSSVGAVLASGKTFEPKSTSTSAPPVGEKQKPTSVHQAVGQRWAVVIGISRYQDTRISLLRYASDDAKSFYKWLISPSGGQYAPANVKLLLEQDGSFKDIRDALFVWLKQALEEDVVTIYFAGHGSPDSPDSPENLFLLPYDAQYDSIATTGFPMWDIETALKRFIKAKKVIVIADACHAGGVGQPFDIARRANRGLKLNPISTGLQRLTQVGDGICIISASDDNQFSQESKNWGGGHGVFTYFLLQALTGDADYNEDKRVSLGELIPYLSEQVRRETRNAQCPTVAGKFDPALSIGR